MFCKHCGREAKKDDEFCRECGKSHRLINAQADNFSPHPRKSGSRGYKKWIFITLSSLVALGIICAAVYLFVSTRSSVKSTSLIDNTQAVVDILCDTGNGGSGTLFTADGTVLTNNHVITGATTCQVTIPDPVTGQIVSIYNASPVIVPKLSKEYDIATLKIDASYTDSRGKTWGVYPTTFSHFILPSTCDISIPSKLGDTVKIYGYPVTSGGYNLTVTDGVISSFKDNGDILTSAKVDSGNSGGLAIDQNGCWLGIPSAVESGNYQNLGVIIPGDVVEQFLNNVSAKTDAVLLSTTTNALAEEAVTPQATPNQVCQSTFGTYSKSSGKQNANGQPYCTCQTGYAWSVNGSTCVSGVSLNLYCENTYGDGSYSYQNNGAATCGCVDGYEWNSDRTTCVLKESGYQVCANMNGTWDGSSYTASGGYECTCGAEYVSSDDGMSCVIKPQPTCALFSTYDSTTGQCTCDTGYVESNGMCVSNYTYCENKNGYGSTYDSVTNSCECEAGYVYNGSQCVYGNTYCSDRYGIWSEYDYADGGCQCDPGYSSNGSTCISNYSAY